MELLDTDDLELRILATAISANLLSFSDSLLLANEECIDDFADSMEDLLDAAKRYENKRWATIEAHFRCLRCFQALVSEY